MMRALDEVTETTWASAISSGSSGGVDASADERLSIGTTTVALAAAPDLVVLPVVLPAARLTCTSGVCFVGTRVNGRTRGDALAIGVVATGRLSPRTRTSSGAGKSAG